MEFDELIVKESPGLCRCCLSEGCYKELGSEYSWMGDTEVYADMLWECFDISISHHNEGPNGPSRLICEVCITRLRDACNFKKQVVESEKKFVEMVSKGEFRPKVVVFQPDMKLELEGAVGTEPVTTEVEYLEDDIDFGDDELKPEDAIEPSAMDDITVSALPMKGKRGRPKKTEVKVEKKKAKTEERPKTSKTVAKGKVKENNHLRKQRRNLQVLLRYCDGTPFQYHSSGLRCFYCSKPMKDCDTLRTHTNTHKAVDIEDFVQKNVISKNFPVKLDVTNLRCKICFESLNSVEDMVEHISVAHEFMADLNADCVFPFKLSKSIMNCELCELSFDNLTMLITHMNRLHMKQNFICQICGLSYINNTRLKRHLVASHEGYRCSVCGKLFDAFYKLDKHRQMFHGKTHQYNCQLCSSNFNNTYLLKVHMGKVHNVEKYRLKCEECPKVFNTKGALTMHVKYIHTDAKFSCELCDYKSSIKWLLTLHKRKHYGEKDYECTMCLRKFSRSSNLRSHIKVHTGQIGRVCRYCKKGFADANALKIHSETEHVDRGEKVVTEFQLD